MLPPERTCSAHTTVCGKLSGEHSQAAEQRFGVSFDLHVYNRGVRSQVVLSPRESVRRHCIGLCPPRRGASLSDADAAGPQGFIHGHHCSAVMEAYESHLICGEGWYAALR